ncbi:MAG: hypothetical protein HY569_01575 [Candidatus Magasanikbacteria bacterium]|nr:hypothetical protein [Candidatus Magasanikbacteria bacterium]
MIGDIRDNIEIGDRSSLSSAEERENIYQTKNRLGFNEGRFFVFLKRHDEYRVRIEGGQRWDTDRVKEKNEDESD